jgi:hypothetical protein
LVSPLMYSLEAFVTGAGLSNGHLVECKSRASLLPTVSA